VVFDICEQTDRQTDRHADSNTLHPTESEMIKCEMLHDVTLQLTTLCNMYNTYINGPRTDVCRTANSYG